MFYTLGSLAPQDVFAGYRARIYHGEKVTFAVLEVEANAKLPLHHHTNEQVGLLVRGQLTFTVDGERRTVRPGDGWVIPPEASHDAIAGPDGAIVIETWAPPRHDFSDLPLLPLDKPAWP
ncbi:MAG: cupin domain-containing protein [Candidatus Cybelea sp.]|jgi:quercetin dioxygenase-like cupin family protein